MAKDDIPKLSHLDRPEKLEDLLKQDREDDCLSCKIVGGGAFLGLAGYSYITGQQQLQAQKAAILASKSPFGMRSRSAAITGLSLGLAYLGLYRLFK
ncbi:hypothetical protein QBC40DRAFT_239307 [Triangularia verruculosa]|uniref:Distal membrane-arm assembly complex protein 1-like domain-containing protein n=1 Tax=Triangularia verruculosa TaxID=2587418 RepID=A0AAN6X501_9PEZI|nr:hypothetical protein QBC40DRAFT_239307 [Triangularia verruculosa]